jgi:hypothetical protein
MALILLNLEGLSGMKSETRHLLVATVALITGGGMASSPAATIADYLLNGIATSSDSETNSSAGSITATGITLGHATVGGQQGLDTTANAVANGDYYSFTVTASPGFQLDLNGGTLTLQDRTTTAGTFNYSVYSSVDSFTSSLGNFSLATANAWTGRTVNLSGAAFDDLSTVTFRLVLGDNNNAASRHLYLDNIQLNGVVVVIPEPSACSVVLLGGLALIGARSRFRKLNFN